MYYFLLLLILCTGCGSSEEDAPPQGEYIFREKEDRRIPFDHYVPQQRPSYPWAPTSEKSLHKITKDYFRCKGFSLNPPKVMKRDGKEVSRYTDCGGGEKHSLPIRNEKEYIFPILIELLNHIQEVTQKEVVITSGHRCPDHNLYLDPSPQNQGTKHLIGAGVDFYVKGLENNPEAVIKIIQNFYKQARYLHQKEYQEFRRFEKPTNVSTQPWYNKEVFVKLYKSNEGRNEDSRHYFPYLSIQVRFDRERNVPLTFTWTDTQHFLRK